MLNNTNKYKAELILIFITILWGATFPIIKEALNDISSLTFISIRFAFAGIFLLPFVIKKRFTKKAAKSGILLGVFLFLGFAAQTFGLKYTTAIKSSFLTGTVVIMVPILQLLIEKKPPNKGVIFGVIIVTIGISFLSSGGKSILNLFSDLGSNFNLGEILSLFCAFFYAIYIVLLDVESNKYDFWILLFYQIVAIAVLSTGFMFLFDATSIEHIKVDITKNLIWAVFYTSIFTTLITTALQTKYQKSVTPAKAGIIFSLEPIVATILAFFLLGEKITNFGYIGAALIIIGLLTAELYESLMLKKKEN
ncbi:MAG: multidrug DMT transporter permease [Ignavibacteriae bacterium]|nr:MAG: multidrug DMT transporter permease [Ignavibacteriota bacterium]